MTDISVTVAVASSGRPEALARCLHALAAGTAPPHQTLVVDQARSAQTRRVVERCGIAGARYLEQPRLGLSASRNLALEVAGSEVLAVIDDDCQPDRGWVQSISAAFQRAPVPAAVTGPILTLGPRPPGLHAISLRTDMQGRDYRGRMLPWVAGSGGNFAARRELLRRLGGWDERLGAGSPGKAAEDADLLYRMLRDGQLVRYEPAAVVRHEWQTWERRLATRASYGYGIGALCGIWLRRGDWFALRMLGAYAGLHVRCLAAALRRHDRSAASEHARALASSLPGAVYGLRVPAGGRAQASSAM